MYHDAQESIKELDWTVAIGDVSTIFYKMELLSNDSKNFSICYLIRWLIDNFRLSTAYLDYTHTREQLKYTWTTAIEFITQVTFWKHFSQQVIPVR